jgi:uncharacterized protein (DUF362 family)
MKYLSLLILLVAIPTLAFPATKSKIYIIKTTGRIEGIKTLLKQSSLPELKGKKVIIKPNFNSDDPFPATTHLDTLRTVIESLKAHSPASITILERSGMGDTDKILKDRGVYALAQKEGVKVINLDRLDKSEWVRKGEKGTHWLKGFLIPKMLLEADYVVNLPCLKTHRFGGDFTLSLKNNVGLVAKWDGAYNYMWELHASPSQRLMIAEINKDIPNHLVIMDGIKGFSTAGPDKGKMIEPGLLLLSTNRVAIDAVGVAVLRSYGTTPKVSRGKIFDQDQIKRSAELGIGAKSAAEIEVIPLNAEAQNIAKAIKKILTSQ